MEEKRRKIMMKKKWAKNDCNGFTLLELTVVVVILAVLAAVLIPSVGNMLDKAKTTQVLRMVENLREACNMYYKDMGDFPAEWEVSAASPHELSEDQGGNWIGPYLDTPLKQADSPFESTVRVYSPLTAPPSSPGGSGFDFDGDGSDGTDGDGSILYFANCPQNIAERVDNEIDEGVPGDWGTGKVEYDTGASELGIYLTGKR